MKAFSLGMVWEETIAFLRRESGLLVPVALAIFGPAQLMLSAGMGAMVAVQAKGPQASTGLELLLIPAGLLVLLGNMVITRLVVVPGTSVGEALAGSVRRLPTAVIAMLLVMATVMAAALLIIIAGTIGSTILTRGRPSASTMMQLAVLIAIPFGLVWIRLLLLPSVIASEAQTPIGSVRRAWDLGAGNVLRLIAIWMLVLFLGLLIATVEQFVVGSLAELLKLATGDASLANVLRLIVNAAIEALLSLGFGVYVAIVYRRLAAG
jgi:hypothetical protein